MQSTLTRGRLPQHPSSKRFHADNALTEPTRPQLNLLEATLNKAYYTKKEYKEKRHKFSRREYKQFKILTFKVIFEIFYFLNIQIILINS